MLKIKLARFGKKNQPHYRIVVNEARDKRDGKYVALLGHYAPAGKEKLLDLDVKAFDEWLAKGAQPTPTVASLYTRAKSDNPFPAKKPRLSKKAKAKAAAPKVEAPAPEAAAPAPEPESPAPVEAPAPEEKTPEAPAAV